MRSSNLLFLLLLVLAALIWLFALQPEQAESLIHYLRSYRPPPKPPVTCDNRSAELTAKPAGHHAPHLRRSPLRLRLRRALDWHGGADR